MAIEKVRAYFEQFGIADRIKEFHESSATVELAAHALCTEPCRIAKTLSFMLGDKAILIVTAGELLSVGIKKVIPCVNRYRRRLPFRYQRRRHGIPGRIAEKIRDGFPRLRQQ